MKVHTLILAALIGTVVVANCAPRRTASSIELSVCPPTDAPGSSWSDVAAGGVNFALPPGYRPIELRGIDSYVRGYTSSDGSSEVRLNSGWYSNSLRYDPDIYVEYQTCIEVIAGRRATIVIAMLRAASESNRPHVVAAAWRDVYSSPTPVHVTIWTTTRRASDRDQLLQIIRTTRIPNSVDDTRNEY